MRPKIITKFAWKFDKTFARRDNLTEQGNVVVFKGDKYFKLVYKFEKIAMGEIKYKV